jgi:hypothetical protein
MALSPNDQRPGSSESGSGAPGRFGRSSSHSGCTPVTWGGAISNGSASFGMRPPPKWPS